MNSPGPEIPTLKCHGAVWLSMSLLLITLAMTFGLTLTLYLLNQTENVIWHEKGHELKQQSQQTTSEAAARLLHRAQWNSNLPTNLQPLLHGTQSVAKQFSQSDVTTLSIQHAEGIFEHQQQFSIIRMPLLINLPPAPLLLHQGLEAQAGFSLHSPSSQLHPFGRLSLWSPLPVDVSPGNRIRCDLTSTSRLDCASNQFGKRPAELTDIRTTDATLPSSPLNYLFAAHMEQADHSVYQALAWQQLSSCQQVKPGSIFVWVTGNCQLSGLQSIGTSTVPVLLVVQNGDITLSDKAQIYGLVVSLRVNTLFSFRIFMADEAAITGSLVLGHPASLNTHIQVLYDYPLLAKLRRHPSLQQIVRIPGTAR